MIIYDDQIIPTIKKMRISRDRKRDKYFLQLTDKFKPLLISLLKNLLYLADDSRERRIIEFTIQRTFYEVLMKETIDFNRPPKMITKYVIKSLSSKINQSGMLKELGKSNFQNIDNLGENSVSEKMVIGKEIETNFLKLIEETLTPKQQEICKLYYLENFKRREVAKMLNLSSRKLKTQLDTTTDKLKRKKDLIAIILN